MSIRSSFFLAAFFFFLPSPLVAQDAGNSAHENFLNEQSERFEQAGDEQGLLAEEEARRQKNPVAINKAGREELELLGILNPLQIEHFLRYRRVMGPLIDKYELQAIPGWDLATIRSVLPLLTFEHTGNSFRQLNKSSEGDFHHQLLFRIGNDQLFSKEKKPDAYSGDLTRFLMRYQYQTKSLSMGYTTSKDAGESWGQANPFRLLDFHSFHFQVRPTGIIHQLLLGDFTVQLGQGLIQWQRLAFGKSGELTAIKRQGESLQPYRSSGAYYFFRGGGVVMAKGKHQWTVFGSGRKLDARIVIDSLGQRLPYATSINRSGYHRTLSELQSQRSLGLVSWGGQWKYRVDRGHIAFNTVHHQFRQQLEPGTQPYALFYFRGRELSNYSIDHSLTFRNIHWFGEWATRGFRSTAWSTGVLMSLHHRLDAALLYRNWAPAYQAFFANGFGEGSTVSNESGLYTALVFRPSHSFRIEWMADLYRNPWLRYRQPQPVYGAEQRIKLSYSFSRNVSIYFLIRRRVGDEFISTPEFHLYSRVMSRIIQTRVHAEGRFENGWEMQLRMETFQAESGTLFRHGYLCYSDIERRFSHSGSRLRFRLQYFSTDDFSSRIYAYEPDVQYAGRIRFFYGEGFRWCANAAVPLVKRKPPHRPCQIQFWVRIAKFISLASGDNLLIINPNMDYSSLELQGQLQLQF